MLTVVTNRCINKLHSCRGPVTARGLCRSCYKKEYRLKNQLKLLSQEKQQRNANRETIRTSLRKYKYSTKGRYKFTQSSAKQRSLSCTIGPELYAELITKPCFYCEKPLPDSCCVGLDRLDNKRGYEPDNVVPCCRDCNVMRGDKFTSAEFKVMIKALLEYRSKSA